MTFTNVQKAAINNFNNDPDNKNIGMNLYYLYSLKRMNDKYKSDIDIKNIDQTIKQLKENRNDYKIISGFEGKYEFLSNYYEIKEGVRKGDFKSFDGFLYKSSEAAYQAQKFSDPKDQEKFTSLSPDEAKKLGESASLDADWENKKVDIMKNIVKNKFYRDEDLAKKLTETGDSILIEENWWGDKFWGVTYNSKGILEGKNTLGKILMEIRSEFELINSFWNNLLKFDLKFGNMLLQLITPSDFYKNKECVGLYPTCNDFHQYYSQETEAKEFIDLNFSTPFLSDYINVLMRDKSDGSITINTFSKGQLLYSSYNGNLQAIYTPSNMDYNYPIVTNNSNPSDSYSDDIDDEDDWKSEF